MKPITHKFGPMRDGTIRLLVRTYGDRSSKTKAKDYMFEGKLNPIQNMNALNDILFRQIGRE